MTAKFALFLSPEGIALAHRQDAGHWAFIGETRIDVPDLDAAIKALHEKAVERGDASPEAVLVLPDDQILYTSFMAPASDPALTRSRIEDGLDGLTPYPVPDLIYDYRAVEEDRVKVAVAAQETLDEARGFAEGHGFTAVGFAAMPPTERFPGVPVFALEGAEDLGLTADGLQFGPDQWGLPAAAAPYKADDPEEATAAPDAPASPEADPSPEAAQDDTAQEDTDATDTTPDGEAKAAAAQDETAAAATSVAQDAENRVKAPTVSADPEPDQPDTQASADQGMEDDTPVMGLGDLGLSKPVRPLTEAADNQDPPAEGEAAAPEAPQANAAQSETAPDTSPPDAGPDGPDPLPVPTFQRSSNTRKLRFSARSGLPDVEPALADTQAGLDKKAPDTAKAALPEPDAASPTTKGPSLGAAPKVGFTVRRGKERADPASAGQGVAKRKSRLAFNVTSKPKEGQRLHPDADVPAGASDRSLGPDPTPPKRSLTGQLARVRDAAKTKPKPKEAATTPFGIASTKAESTAPTPKTAPPLTRRTALDPPEQPPKAPSRFSKMARSLSGSTAGAAKGLAPKRSTAKDPAPTASHPAASNETAAATADDPLMAGMLARKSVPASGPSMRTGLILTLVLLLLLAAIAAWSVMFLPNSPIARMFGAGTPEVTEAEPSVEPAPAIPAAPLTEETALPATRQPGEPDLAQDTVDEVAALEPEVEAAPVEPVAELPDIDAELDLEPLPPLPEDLLPSLEETQRIYAEDGIWPRTPPRPTLSSFSTLDGMYVAGIDSQVAGLDAIALSPAATDPFESFRRIPSPPPFGSSFDVGDSGLVEPTPEGVVTPTGAFVRLGRPPVEAVPRPRDAAPAATAAPDLGVEDAILGTFRPTPRPGDLEEVRERQILGGLTTSELAERRPALRPTSAQEAAAQASLFDTADGDVGVQEEISGSALAVASSRMPQVRPSNMDALVAAAVRTPAPAAVAPVPAAAAAPQPSVPSSASVTRAATETNAIRLRNVNLIGVTGTSSARTALVRLPSGRFVRVGVGDRLDGGRVAAIGENSLQYVRSGRNITLEIPG